MNSRGVGTEDLNEVLNESDHMIINITTAGRDNNYQKSKYQDYMNTQNDNNNFDSE